MSTRRLLRTAVGPKFSEGARQLWITLGRRECSQTELAAALGASSALFSRWLWGDRRPELAWAEKLERTFHIPMGDWMHPPRETFVPPTHIAATPRSAKTPAGGAS